MNSKDGRYLVRFDDINAAMDWEGWSRIESVLEQHGIRPMLGVVPNNCDPLLERGRPRDDFWARVRNWQSRGWAIGLHGYDHVYVNRETGIIGIGTKSEFAGLSYSKQTAKIRAGLEVFRTWGVSADCWIAPSHSFDTVTVRVLEAQGLDVISDGLWTEPFIDSRGITWVPQQMWDRIRDRPWGVWTVCYHHNNWCERSHKEFADDIAHYRDRITDLMSVLTRDWERGPTLTARFGAWYRLWREHRIRAIWRGLKLKGGRDGRTKVLPLRGLNIY